jgi:hypothetical protein
MTTQGLLVSGERTQDPAGASVSVMSSSSAPEVIIRALQQDDHGNHGHDEHDRSQGHPGAPVFLLSRVLSCTRFLIPCGSLCGPSGLLLLSGFLRLRHVRPLFSARWSALHHWGERHKPPICSSSVSRRWQ